jgi:hypothetical protein
MISSGEGENAKHQPRRDEGDRHQERSPTSGENRPHGEKWRANMLLEIILRASPTLPRGGANGTIAWQRSRKGFGML